MTTEQEIEASVEYINRLEKDSKEIQDGILAMQKHIADTHKQIDLNTGALSYNQILLKSHRDKLDVLRAALATPPDVK